MDGHANHIIVDVVNKAKAIGLDIITLPSYTQHALKPLDVSCFKWFSPLFVIVMILGHWLIQELERKRKILQIG